MERWSVLRWGDAAMGAERARTNCEAARGNAKAAPGMHRPQRAEARIGWAGESVARGGSSEQQGNGKHCGSRWQQGKLTLAQEAEALQHGRRS
jgi:hypothetical protein